MGEHLVSIIVPCYNARNWIGDCLTSLIAQTYRPLEVLVIDDGSTDGGLQIIQQYVEHNPDLIQYETGPNRGACSARNRGYSKSQGTYIMFLDADDFLSHDAIEGLVNGISEDTKAIANCPSCRYVKDDVSWKIVEHEFAILSAQSNDYLRLFLLSSSPPPCSLLWHRDIVSCIGGWDETLSAYQDVDFLFRAFLLGGGNLKKVRTGLAYYRSSGADSISQNNSEKALYSRLVVLNKIQALMVDRDLFARYRIALGQAFYGHAVRYMLIHHKLATEFLHRAYEIGGRQSVTGSVIHKILSSLMGLRTKLWLSNVISRCGISRSIHLRIILLS